MKVIEFITFCYFDVDACRVRLPPFSANEPNHPSAQQRPAKRLIDRSLRNHLFRAWLLDLLRLGRAASVTEQI